MKNTKQEVVIIGGGGHARVIASILRDSEEYECGGYTDLDDLGTISNCRYLGKDETIITDTEHTYQVVLGISYLESVDLEIRKTLIDKFTGHSHIRFPVILAGSAIVDSGATVGNGTVIMNGAVINTGTTIGEFCVINTNATVDHNCILGDNVQVSPGATLSGEIVTGNHVFIGAGASVIDGIKIGSDVIIGAGAAVVDDIPEGETWAGNPARKIK